MVSTPNKHHNDTDALKLVINSLTQIARLLIVVGTPFYLLLFLVTKLIVLAKNTTGQYISNISKTGKPKSLYSKKHKKTAIALSPNMSKREELKKVLIDNKEGFSSFYWLYNRRAYNKLRAKLLSFKLELYEISLKLEVLIALLKKLIYKTINYLDQPLLTRSGKKAALQPFSKILISYEPNFAKSLYAGLSKFINADYLKLLNKRLKKSYLNFAVLNLKRRVSTRKLPKLKANQFIHKSIKLKYFLLKLKLKTLPNLFFLRRKVVFLKTKIVLFALGGMLLGVGILSFAFWGLVLAGLPSPSDLVNRENYEVSTKIYDRNGVLLYKIFKNKNRTPIELEDIPIHVRLATLAIEDAEFYSHPGFSIRGIARSLLKNVREGELSGGSTITQQLVKNAFLTSEKTLLRKLKEVTLAVQVEMQYDKDQILEMYLNEVSYGGTAYGIQEASRMYFNKDAGQLSLAEAALLAGLPKSPTQFSPFGANPAMAKVRQKQVLHLMRVNKYISNEQENEALAETIDYSLNAVDIKAPHFVMYVRQLLEEKYGKEMVEQGGLEVVTTLDYEVQQMAERAVREEVDKLARLNVGNGAAVVVKPATGEILAMVGSKDYFETDNDGNVNITTSLQSPGSSIKAVNYAYALSNGYTPASIIEDTPITYNIAGSPPYTPKNYDNTFKGQLTLRSAFAQSRNIPAVRILDSYGVNNMIELGRKMGISTWEDPSRYGLSLTLGGGEITLLDLTQVYATIANYGQRPEITSILKVSNFKNQILEEYDCEYNYSAPLVASANNIVTDVSSSSAYILKKNTKTTCQYQQVLDPRVAYMITDILKDNNARAPAFGTNSQLVIPNHKEIAVKTGTSNDLRDNLTIGYNQFYLVTVWVGNTDNSPMSRIASGITGAAPIFNKIMTGLVSRDKNHDWEVPAGLVKVSVCTVTGTRSCPGCPNREEWFLEENQPAGQCSQEWLKRLREKIDGKKDEGDDDKNDKEENEGNNQGNENRRRRDRFFIFGD